MPGSYTPPPVADTGGTPDDGSVTDAKVAANAAIAESKLNLASDAAAGTASRRSLGTTATKAAAGNDARLSDARAPAATPVTASGNLGATSTFTLTRAHEWLTGTLTANCTLTIAGLAAGSSVRLLLAQNATGGWSLALTVGGSTVSVPVATGPSATTVIDGYYDGTNFYVRGNGA